MDTTAQIATADLIEEQDFSRRQARIRLSCFYFGQGFVFASWASRIPQIKAALGLSDATLGSILLALPLAQLLFMPISGRLVTKFGSKKILKAATPFYALCLTNIVWANSGWQLALCLFLFGIAGNVSNISLNTHGVLTENFYGKPINTSLHGSWSLGLFSGALFGLLAINLHLPLGYHFFTVAVLAWAHIYFNKRYLIAGSLPAKEGDKKSLFVKPKGVLVQLGIVAFCSMAAEGTMMDWSGVYFQDIVKAPAKLVILGYTTYAAMMTTGRFLGDKLIAKFGRKKVLQLSGLLISAGMFISVAFPFIVTACLGFMLVGIGVATIVPTTYSLAGNNKEVPPGVALAMVSGVGYLGFLMGPPLIGYISELFNLRYAYAFIGCFGLLIAFVVSKVRAIAQ